MPRWSNGPLTAYHGTDSLALAPYGSLVLHNPVAGFSISIARCRPNTDFGQGFYLTTNDHQARQWANARVRRMLSSRGGALRAVVLSFSIDRHARLLGLDPRLPTWLSAPCQTGRQDLI
jgi:hypothetical protein